MKLSVPPLDLKAEYLEIRSEVNKRIQNVIRSGHFILGPQVEEFEHRFARFVGTKYALGIASGSDGLLLSLMAKGIQGGNEVITTPFTFIATAMAIVRLGAKPVFADIEPDTFNIDPVEIERRITKKTRAIIVVHLYGNPCRMDEIQRIAKRHQLFLIEDCAQACGATFQNQKVGSFGNVGAFSFYPTKTLGAWGDGGAMTTDDPKLYKKLKSLRHHGDSGKHHDYRHPYIGINSRLDELQAAVLNAKLKHLNLWNEKRRKVAKRYHQLIRTSRSENLLLPEETTKARSVYHQYTLRVQNGRRDQLVRHLRSDGISTAVFYPIPLHRQPCFRPFGYREALAQAEKASSEVLSLPIYPQLKENQQIYVVKKLLSFFSK